MYTSPWVNYLTKVSVSPLVKVGIIPPANRLVRGLNELIYSKYVQYLAYTKYSIKFS